MKHSSIYRPLPIIINVEKVLLAHVVPGRVLSSDLRSGLRAGTALDGFQLRFDLGRRGAKVNGIDIIQADVQASNGVVHVVDSVINPLQEVS